MHPEKTAQPAPAVPDQATLPGAPGPRWRGTAAFAAALVLHALLLAGVAAVMADRQGLFTDGVLMVALSGAVPNGAAAETAEGPAPARPLPGATAESTPSPADTPPSPILPQTPATPLPRKTPERPRQAPAPQKDFRTPEPESTPATDNGRGEQASSAPERAGDGAAGGEQKGSGPGGPALQAAPGGYELGDVDTRPALLQGGKPEYPPLARRKGTQGSVMVRMLVSAHGVPGDISILKADPPGVFDSSVLKSVLSWRYSPAMKDGRAVPVWVVVPLHFSLH